MKKSLIYRYEDKRSGSDQWKRRLKRREEQKKKQKQEMDILSRQVKSLQKRLKLAQGAAWGRSEKAMEKAVEKAVEDRDKHWEEMHNEIVQQKIQENCALQLKNDDLQQTNDDLQEKLVIKRWRYGGVCGTWRQKGRNEGYRMLEVCDGEVWREDWSKGFAEGVDDWYRKRVKEEEKEK